MVMGNCRSNSFDSTKVRRRFVEDKYIFVYL